MIRVSEHIGWLVGFDNSVVWVSFILNTIFTQHGLMGYVRDDIKLFKSFCRQTRARTNTPTRTIKFKLKIFVRIDLRCLDVLLLCLYSSFNLAFKSFIVGRPKRHILYIMLK